MTKTVTLLLLFVIVSQLAVPGFAQIDAIDSEAFFHEVSRRPIRTDNSEKIENLLRRMTIEEKVGQMTQLTIDMVTRGKDQNVEIDPDKLEKAVVKYGVGSILNVTNQALTLDHWHRIIRPIQEAAQRTRLKIPVIYGVDSIHGSRSICSAPSTRRRRSR